MNFSGLRLELAARPPCHDDRASRRDRYGGGSSVRLGRRPEQAQRMGSPENLRGPTFAALGGLSTASTSQRHPPAGCVRSWAPEANQKSDCGRVDGNSRCDGSGDDCSVTAPFRRASQRSPSPPQCPVKTGSTDEDNRSMCQLPRDRQHLLGTEQHASSPSARSVTIVRQLELCRAAQRRSKGWRTQARAAATGRRDRGTRPSGSSAKVGPSGSLALQDRMPRAASQTDNAAEMVGSAPDRSAGMPSGSPRDFKCKDNLHDARAPVIRKMKEPRLHRGSYLGATSGARVDSDYHRRP